MPTGFVFHELYLWHDTGSPALYVPAGLTVQPGENAENPETKRRMKNLLDVAGLTEHLTALKPRPASDVELARLHTEEHIANIRAISAAGGGEASEGTPFGAGSFEIGKLAAGGAMVAVEAVLSGEVRNAYALIRPPGHHALANLGMGFCLFANAALAIIHGRKTKGLGRVAVVDWDVHHGNGTEAAFYDDPETLAISLHQDNLFPLGSGSIEARGQGAGFGANLNIPLPPGSGDGAYLAAFDQVVIPALMRFRPDLIVVASGFDASAADPLGRMMVTSDGYRKMTALLMSAADTLCNGRIVMTHEGGYSAAYVPYCGLAVLEEMSGIMTGVKDPFLADFANFGQQALQPHQAAAISAAAKLLEDVPKG
ncbi:MAG: class II histone deacetylase [Paracoccaceae bacterium]|nr:class II histone deacetylase [Paracoccaceae bacterium]MDH5530060.1 class II histone deacetylase [Paracoccaceae bacterium]